ncbi:MAG: IMP dehydrogenase [Candidatus Aenigmarchaeota archaeon]|nr:IMP dehydrogenase [Candidatus Aenigmarchaeota archaeon]
MALRINEKPSRSISEYSLAEFLLLPGYTPQSSPRDVDLSTPLTKYHGDSEHIILKRPVLSAAMQAVTGPRMAIEMAKLGGMGVIYSSQEPAQEAGMIEEVKKYKAGFVDPYTIHPEMILSDVHEITKDRGFSTFPVVKDGKLVGYITDKDYYVNWHGGLPASDRMKRFDLNRARSEVAFAFVDEIGGDLHKANDLLIENKHGSLPIVDRDGTLRYVVFRKDIDEHLENPFEMLDSEKRYMVGAAINTQDYEKRVPLLIEAGVDVLFIDASQGYSEFEKKTLEYVLRNTSDTERALRWVFREFPGVPVIGGNIVTKEGFRFLVENGAYGVKVGMGPGSICTTQEQIGVGRGQATAIIEVSAERGKYFEETGIYIPITSDGGIRSAKDNTITIALNADSNMLGGYIAGCDESPTPVYSRIIDGQEVRVKPYWGEGSDRARKFREGRYQQAGFEEGVEGWVPYTGPLKNYLDVTFAKITEGMRKAGCMSIQELHENSVLEVRSDGAMQEGNVHDVHT